MKIYFVVNARMPTEKAHGIQIAKMCEAFVEQGVSIELVVSSRGSGSLEKTYNLTQKIPVRRLPVLDLQSLRPIGYRLTAFQFVCGALFFLWWKVFLRERFIVYTVDMDPFSYAPLVWIPRPVFAEMHGVKKSRILVRNFFKRAGIIATNNLIGEELARTFNIPPARVCIEPNGVDESLLQDTLSKEEARHRLSLPPDEPFALYVGRVYAWKGLEILADAAKHSPLPIYLVGGTREEYEYVTKRSGKNLRFAGARPVMEVPLWLAAADVLLVLGTAHNTDSYRHTSPMKIFEYLAAGRPVIASKTPANSSIMREDTAFWYEPDNARSLAQAIREAHTSPEAPAKVAAGRALAATHTWRQRAGRILAYMHNTPVPHPHAVEESPVLTGTFLVAGFALVLFFSSFHLFNSPETWMDEGLIIQSAVGLLHTGKAALPVAPGVYEPAWYITTGFPLTIPLAGTFAVFGVSLEAARLVMLVFLLCFYSALFLYARRAIGGRTAWLSFFFLVFFAPIYGDGRNALGEIPGLLFILLALLPLARGGELTRNRALLAGVGAGLAFASKPIFILFLPALLLAGVLRHRELKLKKVFLFGVLGVCIPVALWVFTQFDNAMFSQVLAVYANPHEVNVGSAIAANITRLFTETKPLYFLLALALWVTSYATRRFRSETVRLTEEALLFFSVLVLLAYLRTAGYYRYFLPAQVFALLYLPQSIGYLVRGSGQVISRAAIVLLSALMLFQAYETAFRSWTAVHYDSVRTESLERYFAGLPAGEEIFVYQAPEIVPFAGARPLYQFVRITPSIRAGEAYAPRVLSGKTPLVMTPTEFFQAHPNDIFAHYTITQVLDNYVILIPNPVGR